MSKADEFEKIGREVVERLEKVDCSVEEFIEGCSIVIEEISLSREAAEECAQATRRTDRDRA